MWYTHPFNGPFSGTTRVSWYQKGKTNLDFTEARDSKWQWHQLGHIMQVCISLQTDNHASTPTLKFFAGRMPFLPPNQQCQSTEGTVRKYVRTYVRYVRTYVPYLTYLTYCTYLYVLYCTYRPYKCGSIKEMVQDRHVVTTHQ